MASSLVLLYMWSSPFIDHAIKILHHGVKLKCTVLCVCTQSTDKDVVLVMELCDLDLDKLLELKQFKEHDIILFLHQFS